MNYICNMKIHLTILILALICFTSCFRDIRTCHFADFHYPGDYIAFIKATKFSDTIYLKPEINDGLSFFTINFSDTINKLKLKNYQIDTFTNWPYYAGQAQFRLNEKNSNLHQVIINFKNHYPKGSVNQQSITCECCEAGCYDCYCCKI